MAAERPKIRIDKQFFQKREEAEADTKKTGHVKTRELTQPPNAGELPLHWHPHNIISYVLQGEQYFVVDEEGTKITAQAGDRIVIPAGALHAEGKIDKPVTYLTTREDNGVALKDALHMYKPESPMDSKNPEAYHREAETDRTAAAVLPSKL